MKAEHLTEMKLINYLSIFLNYLRDLLLLKKKWMKLWKRYISKDFVIKYEIQTPEGIVERDVFIDWWIRLNADDENLAIDDPADENVPIQGLMPEEIDGM